MSEVATHRWHNAAALFIQSHSSYPFPLPLLVSLKHGLTVGHTCSMKEMEWVRRIGAMQVTSWASHGVQTDMHTDKIWYWTF